MGKRLFTFAANAPLRLLGLAAVIAACGGSTDPTMPETSVSRTSPGGAGDPGAPTVGTAPLPTPGPDHVADNVGAPAAITMTKDMVVFITRKTTIDDKLVDAGALFVADKKVGRAMMTGLDRQGATYEALATDGATAFVATSDARIVAVSVMGGDARLVGTLPAPATAMTVSANHVYFATSLGDIGRVLKTGGEPEALGAVETSVRGLEVDEQGVYVATADPTRSGITRIALDAEHTTKVLTDKSEPCAMIRDGKRLFWTTNDKGAVLRLSLDGTSDVATVASGSFSACAIAADDKDLWFATTVPGLLPAKVAGGSEAGLGLMRAPIAGGAPISVTAAARALPQPGAVAVDATHVYWLTSTSVLRLRK